MCSPEYPCHIKKKKIRFSYTFSLGDSIPELQVIKLLITELKGKKKKGFKRICRRVDAAGQCIWEHDGSSISSGCSHEHWIVF